MLMNSQCDCNKYRGSIFGREQVRETEKTIRKGQRDLQRDRLQLEREEKKLELEIKKAAKDGNKQVATILAKQLIALRKQKTKTYIAGSKMQAIGTQTKVLSDTLDDMLEESGDESEEEAIVNKVLDEIGIEISGKLAEAPSAHKEAVSKSTEEDEIEKQLAKLKAP
ncbi:hypothetical protein LSH36_533g01057 [Paralvinella palmiformis]|uniref:Uncharacterized protein n=1 Tax=Paralvinella palmiformis TaxID=53620 RepID=A0AAD9J8I6_9ANNE|nr:hypothetical protein LSH36_533g01057 [Paralvinella palmiformis]